MAEKKNHENKKMRLKKPGRGQWGRLIRKFGLVLGLGCLQTERSLKRNSPEKLAWADSHLTI